MAMIAAVFCSCGQQPAQERGPRPVKLAEVTSLSRIEKSYSGVVSPDQFSDLAFKMSGPLVAMNVLEGQRVKKGQVVAEIDPTDYKLDYDAKRASFQKGRNGSRRSPIRNGTPVGREAGYSSSTTRMTAIPIVSTTGRTAISSAGAANRRRRHTPTKSM